MTASTPAYDPSNIFMKILHAQMPCHKVYEDAHSFAFMDIMPRSEGHTLVIPKTGSRNILDTDPDDLAHVIRTVQRIAQAAKRAFDADGVTVAQFSEPAGGQVIFHTHFHVLPRWDGVELGPTGHRGDDAQIKANAERLQAALQH